MAKLAEVFRSSQTALDARRCLFMRWYGHRGDAVLPVSACWQQQACVMVTPSAELSH